MEPSLQPFLLWLFLIGFHFLPRLGWTANILFIDSYFSWDDRCLPPCLLFSIEVGSCELFGPWLAENHDLANLSLLHTCNDSSIPMCSASFHILDHAFLCTLILNLNAITFSFFCAFGIIAMIYC
jgi:hypothetical protein